MSINHNTYNVYDFCDIYMPTTNKDYKFDGV